MPSAEYELLAAAAKDALRAPSVLNTQPWSWHLKGGALELHADRSRQLAVVDPLGKLLLLSCGVALHHARLSLAGNGRSAEVERLVSGLDDDLLARITVGHPGGLTAPESEMHRATWRRRTDRRPFDDLPVSAETVGQLRSAAESEGSFLHRVRYDQMPMLAVAAAQASELEMSNASARVELMRWTNRPEWSGDGVPANTAVQHVPRRVSVRELTLPPNEGMAIEPGGDLGSAYVVVYGDGDEGPDWFAAGEAASAVMLTAASLGLAIAPMSDVIEVAHTRQLITGLLPRQGYPYLVLRCGWPMGDNEPGRAPRRPAKEAIVGLTDE